MDNKTVKLRYFASIREAIGLGVEPWSTTAETVAVLRAELAARGGAYAQALGAGRPVRVAVNQVMARDDEGVPSGAEVAFFPPVTGG